MVGVGTYNMAGASDCRIRGPRLPVVVMLMLTLRLIEFGDGQVKPTELSLRRFLAILVREAIPLTPDSFNA